ncbi:alpha carbonic anhydrase 7 [Amborella trichopoda]|uniref:alpha carbonic anhydrase 7 n=1 Tax=Amborella trichopoda TaxID=13333 RepID=UPI0009BFE3CB|nr:alpha carbonic anhydrase 7 [Amborella trichopoda]|eukprot:XP_020523868.1 alpha carbonic anhydrase 7 [Amborella trichopoda]
MMSITFCRERIAMDLCRTSLWFTSSFIIFFIITQSVPSASQEVEDEREFDYLEGSEKGPKHWGELHPEWAACSNGDMQSPIDLLQERVEVLPNLGRLKREYKPAKAILENRGHDIMLKWEESGAGTLEINQTEYVLKQCHWHSPSEHTFNGSRYSLEVHLVHESKVGKVAVVGITYKIGRPDSFLVEVTASLSKTLSIIVWHVTQEAEANARPTQPINERAVHLYTPRRLSPALHF